jgi:hypothetical protein
MEGQRTTFNGCKLCFAIYIHCHHRRHRSLLSGYAQSEVMSVIGILVTLILNGKCSASNSYEGSALSREVMKTEL